MAAALVLLLSHAAFAQKDVSGAELAVARAGQATGTGATVLKPADYRHYVDLFRIQEQEATGKVYPGEGGEDSWAWMQHEIPWFDSSDKKFEEMYYFRWYAWKKHLVKTPHGYVITEWLPKAGFKDGSFGALPDAAAFHIGEARWLREGKIAEDDARYWFSPGVDVQKYSGWMAATVRNLTLANGDEALGTALLPAMVENYRNWEKGHQDANRLFWSIDTRDAMEKSISGDGYRPTLNSYMYADARAIADISAEPAQKAEFTAKPTPCTGSLKRNSGTRRTSSTRFYRQRRTLAFVRKRSSSIPEQRCNSLAFVSRLDTFPGCSEYRRPHMQ